MLKGSTTVKIMFLWQLSYIGGGAACTVATRMFQFRFQTAAPLFFAWQVFSFAVYLPAIYYWQDGDLRAKVAKKARHIILTSHPLVRVRH